MNAKDNLFLNQSGENDFVFDNKVVSVFPDMINRSVPGYSTILSMIGTFTGKYAAKNSHCYDLGCSLGGATFAMRSNVQQEGCRIIAVDNSQPMIDACKKALLEAESTGTFSSDKIQDVQIDLICEDVLNLSIVNASVVVLNFTLQFIAPENRDNLIKTIYRGMLPGGVLILSEKIRFADEMLNAQFVEMHHSFKEQQGYSKLEISRKRAALEKVLIPETVSQHEKRILDAGFNTMDLWFQCFNFASMVALKS